MSTLVDDLEGKLEEIEVYKKNIELYEKKIVRAFETVEIGMSMTRQMIAAQNNRIKKLTAMIKKLVEKHQL